MTILNALDHAALSPCPADARGFRGRNRNSRSSLFATIHQILHGRLRVANHRASRDFDEAIVPLSGSRDRLVPDPLRRFWYAGEQDFGEAVHVREQRLLCPADPE
jgi:hypothetical protein